MGKVILLTISLFFISTTLIVLVLYFIQKHKNKKYKEQIDKLEIEKNKLDSSPVIPELSKIESYLNNEKLEAMYNNWKNRLEVIRTNQIPKITDMLLDTDYSLSKMDYKKTLYKIARLEMEIYKVRTNSEFLLNEIKEITGSEERNRAIITKLKIKYRELYQQFQNSKTEFGENAEVVELQFENMARKFEEFETLMEKNEYTEVTPVVKSIDEMIKHMTNVIEELPGINLIATSILPKKIEEVKEKYEKMTEMGYPLDYLNVEYNIKESEEKITDILSRAKDLNIEDSLFDLKVLLDYFESLFTDFEKEKVNRVDYEDANKIFKNKYDKIDNLLNEILKDIDEIKRLYNLSDIQLEELYNIKKDLDTLYNDYNVLIKHTSNNTFAYSKLTKEIETLSLKLANLDERVEVILDSIGSMKEDEVRARQQLEEIKNILKESKTKIREYNLPVIPKNYFIELNDAQVAIKEIIKELDKKPITIEVLNTRVDTARDLVLKLYQTTKEMVRTAMFAEMAIVYGNRYRSSVNDLDKYLRYSEKLFYRGDYKKSLEITINTLNKVEDGIYEKLLKLYSNN
ncbi:MAG: hypothetical protein E7157_01630 [Lactobacillales bacterium]|nr:hypothetical protein [Lactobacillales bacterium]